ncbi:divalent-cation tolerance protein CutA [Streptosporangium sp. NPDC001559]|uniref:divalent-cation tolerance protein CutA n=1 Tax=Streptosporangium sp. NPDC001559 TaxID=3366187 RepID=UPI0036E18B21
MRTIRQCCSVVGNASDCVEVRVTVGSRGEVSRVCSAVVEERLAAAAQVVASLESVYWWAGEIWRADEWLVVMMTTVGRFEALAVRVRELHSCEVPQIVAAPLVAGTADYLEWIRRETSPEPGGWK